MGRGGARLLEVGQLQLAPIVAQGKVERDAPKVRVGHVDPGRKVLGVWTTGLSGAAGIRDHRPG